MKDRPRNSYKQTAIILGAGVLIILTLSVVGKLLNPSPQQGETITIDKPEPEIIEPEPEPLDPQIHQAANCQRDSQAAYLTLEEAMTSANSELRIGRAQDWIAYAREQCRQLGSKCGSDRAYLIVLFKAHSEKVLRHTLITETQIVGNSKVDVEFQKIAIDESVGDYRDATETLMDISRAITIAGTADIPNRDFVSASDLNIAIENFPTIVDCLRTLGGQTTNE